MDYDRLQSKMVDFLRFPLIVGVVFIHLLATDFAKLGYCGQYPIYYTITELLACVFGRIAVPFFFLIGGYYFFYNARKTDLNFYYNKIKKRCRSQLLPFLIWSVLYMTLNMMIFEDGIIASFSDVVQCVFGNTRIESFTAYPNPAFHLWFLRDLFVMALISPLIYILVKYTKGWIILLLGLMYGLNKTIPIVGLYGLSSIALFFFSIGVYIAINGKTIIEMALRFKSFVYVCLPILIIVLLLVKPWIYSDVIERATTIVALIFLFVIMPKFTKQGVGKSTWFLSSCSFMLYALHAPYFTWVAIGLTEKYAIGNDILATMIYLFYAMIITISSCLVYVLMRIISPKFTAIINCGRS